MASHIQVFLRLRPFRFVAFLVRPFWYRPFRFAAFLDQYLLQQFVWLCVTFKQYGKVLSESRHYCFDEKKLQFYLWFILLIRRQGDDFFMEIYFLSKTC